MDPEGGRGAPEVPAGGDAVAPPSPSGDGHRVPTGRPPGPPGPAPGLLRPAPPGPESGTTLAHVRQALLEAGATEEEIDRAVADDTLDLLAVDRLVLPTTRRYTQHEVAELTGIDVELLRRLWRALGFLDVADEDQAFTDLDIEAVQLFRSLVTTGAADVERAIQMSRVIGSSMARIAEAEVLSSANMATAATSGSVATADAFASTAGTILPAMAKLLDFVWRRHIQVATRTSMLLRQRVVPGANPDLAVGFADMVGFTLLSQHLTTDELASVVTRFEEISHDIVTGLGGRVVKMIGDEVMFVVGGVVPAARIALGLAEAYADDEQLSDVRVGLAFGPVLLREGDYFGPTVNLAHRIVNIADPGTVVTSDEFHQRLAEEAGDEFTGQPLRPRTLKDVGRVQLWWCGRAGHDIEGTGHDADRRRSHRWDRLAEVLRDLEELRDAGERLVSASRQKGIRSGLAEAGGGDPEGA